MQHTCVRPRCLIGSWLLCLTALRGVTQSAGEPLKKRKKKKKQEEKGRQGDQRNLYIKLQATKNTTGKLTKTSG